jgi:transposase
MRNEKQIAKRLYLSGMKLIEIAEELDIPESTVRGWSSAEKWTEQRLKEENLNDRVSKIIDSHLESMEGKDGKTTKENVTILKDLMSIKQSTRVNFVDKVNMMEDLIKFATANKKHEDAQAVAETTKDYIEQEYNKLEE